MLVKILGAIDVFIGLILLFGAGVKLYYLVPLILGVVLLIKSFLGELKDFASWIDRIIGIALIISIFFPLPIFISVIIGLIILQKGVFSFL